MVATVGPWAKDKLDKLGRYLEYYTTVLKNQKWRTIYVDAFAGGGVAIVRQRPTTGVPLLDEVIEVEPDQVEFLDGSPRVALDLNNPFSRYVFIEPTPDRIAELDELVASYGDTRMINVLKTEAAEGIRWVLERNITKKTHRGVAFLDPFGACLEWESVEALAKLGMFEVVINFALSMAIQRMLPNDADIQQTWSDTLDRYFGTHDWFDEVYFREAGLFGDGVLKKRADYSDRLLDLYRKRLESTFGFVSTPRLIRNTRNVPLYYLLWAGPHKKGQEGANYILQMGEKLAKARKQRTVTAAQ